MNILVTGGSSGLGRAIVLEMAKEESNHILFTYCKNKSAADDILANFKNVEARQLDITSVVSVDEFASQIKDYQTDCLVNNAYTGNPLGKQFHRTDPQDFADSFNCNILPLIKITQGCLAGMRKRKYGKIINIITSYVMGVPPAGFSVYTATKAYIRQMSKSISKEYGQYNISSNCVLPEYMHTGFGSVQDYQLEQMITSHPLKKLLLPEEVAEIVSHIIHSSQQMNGVEIPVNAGLQMI